MTSVTRTRILIAAAAILLGTTAGTASAALAGTGQPLVYICNGTQGSTPTCANAQEFEVFDKNGAPIASIGETGGLGVFGDNSSVFAPRSIYSPALVSSYTDPATYNKSFGRPDTCTAPAAWFEPHGIWTCAAGKWIKRISL